LRGDVFLGRVRWQVNLPGTRVALPPPGCAAAETHWVRRGWLLAPEPALTGGDLEQWLTGRETGAGGSPASLVFWAGTLEPVTVVHLPQQLWLLVCSAGLLILGLGLLAAPLSRLAFGVVAGLLGLGLVVAGLSWPAAFPVVLYGCEPGLVVLLLLLGVQWLLHRRYRRRVVFMPGFTRVKTGSSLVRGGSSGQRPRETSTVDAPVSAGSGSKPSGLAKDSAS
jgi:hypothetical protein